ncbi:hypothetical protein BGZ76_005351, partial [Entomortierella beljakovae]
MRSVVKFTQDCVVPQDHVDWIKRNLDNGVEITMQDFAEQFQYYKVEDAELAFQKLLSKSFIGSTVRAGLWTKYDTWSRNEGGNFWADRLVLISKNVTAGALVVGSIDVAKTKINGGSSAPHQQAARSAPSLETSNIENKSMFAGPFTSGDILSSSSSAMLIYILILILLCEIGSDVSISATSHPAGTFQSKDVLVSENDLSNLPALGSSSILETTTLPAQNSSKRRVLSNIQGKIVDVHDLSGQSSEDETSSPESERIESRESTPDEDSNPTKDPFLSYDDENEESAQITQVTGEVLVQSSSSSTTKVPTSLSASSASSLSSSTWQIKKRKMSNAEKELPSISDKTIGANDTHSKKKA